MSKNSFASFCIQSIWFQQLVLQRGRGQSYRREKRMVDLSEADASIIGGPTFMRMQKASFQMMVIVRDCFVAVV